MSSIIIKAFGFNDREIKESILLSNLLATVKSVGEGDSTHSEIYWLTLNSIVLEMKYFHMAQQGNSVYSFNRMIFKIAVENKRYYKKPYRKKGNNWS